MKSALLSGSGLKGRPTRDTERDGNGRAGRSRRSRRARPSAPAPPARRASPMTRMSKAAPASPHHEPSSSGAPSDQTERAGIHRMAHVSVRPGGHHAMAALLLDLDHRRGIAVRLEGQIDEIAAEADQPDAGDLAR